MKNGAKRALLMSMAVGLVIGATGCRDEEQARPMVKQKGIYEGSADEPIAEDLEEELRSRAASQKF
ncbi:MAG: hypothetical protein AAGA21_04525 [Pseudomonadota bacterium]